MGWDGAAGGAVSVGALGLWGLSTGIIANTCSFLFLSFDNRCPNVRAFSGGSKGKESAGRLLAWETEVKSLGPEDPLEKDMATCM